jgi:phytoene dehydrogenase-like protein
MSDTDILVIGSGIGGLVAGALLARYGKSVLVCESHNAPGGAAHEFARQGFRFDSGPSFYCGLGDPQSLNPVRLVLEALGESLETISYDPLGFYHFPEGTLPIYGKSEQYRQAIARFTPQGATEMAALEARFLNLYEALTDIPLLSLRSDWRLLPLIVGRYPAVLPKLLKRLPDIQASAGKILDQAVFASLPGHLWSGHQSRRRDVYRLQNSHPGTLSSRRFHHAWDWRTGRSRFRNYVCQWLGTRGANLRFTEGNGLIPMPCGQSQ